MNVTPQDLAKVAQELSALKDRMAAQSPDTKRAVDILAGIEAALVDLVETAAEEKTESAQMAALIKAVSNLKFEAAAPRVEVTAAPAAVTVNVPEGKAPVVNVEAAKQWTSIEVTPRRDTRTGEIMSYTIKRVA
jgi:hypothetical protein